MKTFTNYAEKKAKQFLNLLHGYTKGIRMTAILVLLLMGVNNAWGDEYTIYSAKIYYDDSNSKWGSNVVVAFDKSDGGAVFSMGNISNTNLHYWEGSWGDGKVTYMRFGKATKTYDWYGWWSNVKSTWDLSTTDSWSGVSNGWGLTINNAYKMFGAKSNSSGADLTKTDLTSYTALNYTQTLKQELSTNNGSSYSTSTTALATVTVSSYTLNSKNTTTSSSGTIASGNSSTTCSAARTATVTYTVESVKTGYTFVGWYDGTTQKSTETTYTYNATAAKTITARFKENTYTVTVNNDGHGTTTPSGAQSNVGQVTGLSIKATPAANYEFVNWTITSGSGSFGSTTSTSTTFKPTSAATIQANFRSTATYSLTVAAGAGIESVAGSKDLVTLGNTYDIEATPKTGYTFSTWTANPAANATFGSATTANTTVTVKNGSVTVTASATENMSTLTTSNQYNAGNPGYEVPTASVNSIGYETTATVTANVAGNGYTFEGWTLTNCTRTDGGTDNATSITVRSNGDGKAATVVAKYEEDLSTAWSLAHSIDDFNTSSHKFIKKTGESTGKVAYVSLDLAANKAYQFKVVNGSKWYGNNNGGKTSDETHWIKQTTENWEFYDDAEDCGMKSALAGTYTFKIDYSGTYPRVSVYYPEIYAIVGTFNEWNENTNPLVFNGNEGTVTIHLSASATNYEFKVIDNGVHGGIDSKTITKTEANMGITVGGGDNIKLTANVYPSGNYTFTYNKSTKKLSVSYPTAYKITYGVGNTKGTTSVTTSPSVTSGTLVLPSTSITFSKGATKDGYTWEGWYSKDDGTGTKWGDGTTYTSTNRTGDISVYACYDLITYSITYHENGGSNIEDATYTVTTADITLPTTITKDGYRFDGWFDNEGLEGNAVTKITKGSTGDKTFYAKWTPITYTIYYELGEGGTNHKDNPATYTIETATTELQDATPNAGYSFGGWYSDSEYANQVTQVAGGTTGNITLYAKWSAKAYTVNFDNNRGDGNTTPVTVAMGDPMPDVEIPTLHGYDFGGYWKDETQYYNADGTSAKDWDIDANDVTLVAKWTAHPYTITYHLDGGTGASNATYTIESEEITLPKPTKQYNAFAGWYNNSDLNGEAITTIASGSTGDKEFWAKWNIGTYAVTLDMEGGNGGTASVNVAYGAAMPTITIPTKNDHLFDGYYDGDNGTGIKYYNADGTSAKKWDKETATLYAKWIPYTKCIFFKNNLKWANVYVYTFKDNVWYDYEDANTKYGPGVCTKTTNNLEFAKMTKIGNTDIYYYALTSETGFCHIAFSDVAMNNWNEFYGGNAVYRADRYDQLPLFVPQTDQTPSTTNSTKYYSTGIWMKYNSTYSGYDWSGKTGNEAWGNHNLTAQDAGGFSFTTTVNLNAGTTYEFKISNIGRDAKNDAIVGSAWYGRTGTTFTPSKHSDITFYTNNENAKITPTVDGQYTFTVYLGDGKVVVSLDYPLLPGDYRLVYKDNTANSAHASHYIKKVSEQASKTESFFVRKDQNAQLFIQKCTAINSGVPAWETIANTTIYINNLIESTGVYNFEFTQNGEAVAITQKAEPYTGSYYIRTDAAAGGWNTFRQDGNKMTYSSYAERNSGLFNHYFCKWVENKKDGEGNDIHTNVKFVIANDYSYCVSDTLDGDEVINDGQRIGFLPQSANVRFGWDSRTNQVSRAYISGSSAVSDRFLVLKGDENLTDLNGDNFNIAELNPHETTFEDMGNWVYQLDVKAGRGTNIQLTARYNGKDQSFFSTSGASLIDATTPQSYKVRFIYDFKTNHLVAAWLLDDIQTSNGAELNSNMLVIRKHHDQAQQLKLNNALTNVGTAYGVMTFDKYFLNNRYSEGANIGKELPENERKSIYERALYWVSFPFDVCIRDVFGFGEYMDTWIMEYYDGEARAMNGAWVDSESYWTYITDLDYVLEAGVGYVLCLDLDKMGYESSVWAHTAEVSLYFPSAQTIGTINANQVVPVTLTQLPCSIERDNRKIYDSNWHVIGVPRFINLDLQLPEYSSIGQENVLYYYKYNAGNNTYDVAESGVETFQVMQAYMVQYAGRIDWTGESQAPAQIAARRNADSGPEKVSLNLELAQDDLTADKTFIQLQEEGATSDFDMNIDLTKIINAGANIYTLVGEGNILTAGNVMPMSECVVPVGVKVDAEGEYTFRMPDGTEGMVVELIDYYTNTRTNLLPYDYTVNLSAGTCNDRFALHIQPSKSGVTTGVENVGDKAKGIEKYLIDGKLIIRTAEGEVFDAQGHRL